MVGLLKTGAAEAGFVSVKAEFEAEGTRIDELLRLLDIARRADIKVAVKIAGCEAVRDLIECRQLGVDTIIAPMVETPYALSKYIAAWARVFPADERQDTVFLFNVETITTLHNLPEMAALAGEPGVGMVFGRVDFAGSLGLSRTIVDQPVMLDHISKVASVARERNLELVVGGGIGTASIPVLRQVRAIRLDRFETRKIVFDAAVLDTDRAEAGLALAVEFELLWLKNKRDHYRTLGAEDEERIAMIEVRLRNASVAGATA